MFWNTKHMIKIWRLFCDFALCFELGFLQCVNEYFLKHNKYSQSSYGAKGQIRVVSQGVNLTPGH
jgi:hypothetical protein